MTRILTEGFELGDCVSFDGYAGSMFYVAMTTQKRSGSYALRTCSSYAHSQIRLALPQDTTEFYLRWGFRIVGISTYGGNELVAWYWRHGTTNLGRIALNYNGGSPIWIFYDGGGTARATSTYLIPNDTWYLFEIHVKIDDAGIYEFKIEGVQDAAMTWSGDTKPGADTHADNLLLWMSNGNSGQDYYWDDIAVNDAASAPDNSWCGDGKIIAILPNGTITNQLMGSDGNTTDNHLLVDDIPSNADTDYVEGSVVDEEDLYDFAACGIATSAVINRIWTESRSRDTVAAGGKVALVTKASGGSEVPGTDRVLTTSYARVLGDAQIVNPVDSGAWEPGDVNALQAGVRTRS